MEGKKNFFLFKTDAECVEIIDDTVDQIKPN